MNDLQVENRELTEELENAEIRIAILTNRLSHATDTLDYLMRMSIEKRNKLSGSIPILRVHTPYNSQGKKAEHFVKQNKKDIEKRYQYGIGNCKLKDKSVSNDEIVFVIEHLSKTYIKELKVFSLSIVYHLFLLGSIKITNEIGELIDHKNYPELSDATLLSFSMDIKNYSKDGL